jgi:hypothetical protein
MEFAGPDCENTTPPDINEIKATMKYFAIRFINSAM